MHPTEKDSASQANDLRQMTERLRLMALAAPRALPDWRLRALIETELRRLAVCIDECFPPKQGPAMRAARGQHTSLRAQLDGLTFQAAGATNLQTLKGGVLQLLDELGEHWASAHGLHLSEIQDEDPGTMD